MIDSFKTRILVCVIKLTNITADPLCSNYSRLNQDSFTWQREFSGNRLRKVSKTNSLHIIRHYFQNAHQIQFNTTFAIWSESIFWVWLPVSGHFAVSFRFISFLDLLQPDVLLFTNHMYTVVGKLKLPLMVVV